MRRKGINKGGIDTTSCLPVACQELCGCYFVFSVNFSQLVAVGNVTNGRHCYRPHTSTPEAAAARGCESSPKWSSSPLTGLWVGRSAHKELNSLLWFVTHCFKVFFFFFKYVSSKCIACGPIDRRSAGEWKVGGRGDWRTLQHFQLHTKDLMILLNKICTQHSLCRPSAAQRGADTLVRAPT